MAFHINSLFTPVIKRKQNHCRITVSWNLVEFLSHTKHYWLLCWSDLVRSAKKYKPHILMDLLFFFYFFFSFFKKEAFWLLIFGKSLVLLKDGFYSPSPLSTDTLQIQLLRLSGLTPVPAAVAGMELPLGRNSFLESVHHIFLRMCNV